MSLGHFPGKDATGPASRLHGTANAFFLDGRWPVLNLHDCGNQVCPAALFVFKECLNGHLLQSERVDRLLGNFIQVPLISLAKGGFHCGIVLNLTLYLGARGEGTSDDSSVSTVDRGRAVVELFAIFLEVCLELDIVVGSIPANRCTLAIGSGSRKIPRLLFETH